MSGERDSGSATIWLLSMTCVVGMAAAVVLAYSAALAGAAAASEQVGAVPVGATRASVTQAAATSTACLAARSVAAANGARLVSCRADGLIVTVVAATTLGRLARFIKPGSPPFAMASARAGPA